MNIYYSQHGLTEGFQILDADSKQDRLAKGRRVSRPSGWALFSHLRHEPMKCHFCGCQADRWVVSKGPSDLVSPPVMNLFSGVHLMTRDHIIPKSLGGKDVVANLRVACAPCNESRSNKVNHSVIKFAQKHPELIDEGRIAQGLKNLADACERLSRNGKQNAAEIARLKKPFVDMGYL